MGHSKIVLKIAVLVLNLIPNILLILTKIELPQSLNGLSREWIFSEDTQGKHDYNSTYMIGCLFMCLDLLHTLSPTFDPDIGMVT